VRGATKVLDVRREGRQVGVVVEDVGRVVGPEVVELNLDEIFEAYVVGKG
jgi:hypothetical protein